MPVTNKEFFMKYKTDLFVELGSFHGDTIQLVLDAGFERIKSIEASFKNYNICYERFKDNKRVKLFYGESEDWFWEMIKDETCQMTIFVDSHYSGVTPTYETFLGRSYSSIRSDLENIAKHPRKDHVILIDDIRDCNTINLDYIKLSEIKELVYKINPNYQISYDTGDVTNELFLNDILVAKI